ncbi:MAG: NAD-dependent epimerase/dehydratase family protein, partial [Anaerolineales bacterium]|nr:NAD-dependent epimerase/dehydratase family protein [Anaerolineales bacterium]
MNLVLVTGGAGFIGSHLVRALLSRGDRVRMLDNFSTGKRDNLADVDGYLEIFEGDLRDPALLQNVAQGVDFVFHFAAFVSVPQSMVEPQLCYDVNVTGTLNLLEAARAAGVKQVVIASSAAVYGESQELPLCEETVSQTLSPYAATKQVSEVFAGMYTHALNLPIVALRFFIVYGPIQSPDTDYAAVIPIFIQRLRDEQAVIIYGDGNQERDFVYVGEVVRAVLLAAEKPQAAGLVINVCSGETVSIIDLAETLSS